MSKLTEDIKEYKRTNVMSSKLYLLLEKEIKEKAIKIFYRTKYGKKGFILANTNKISFEDIHNELWAEILRIIKNYDYTKGEFEYYLYATLSHWSPEIISKQSQRQVLHMKTESEIETNIDEYEKAKTNNFEEKIDIDELFSGLTKNERKFVELQQQFPEKTQAQIADILEVNQSTISRRIKSLRKKIKNA